MLKGSLWCRCHNLKSVMSLVTYIPSKYIRQNRQNIKVKRYIDISSIKVEDFKTPLLKANQTGR